MAAKLKVDESGNLIVSDGQPILVYDDGREAPLDFNALIQTVKQRAEEAETLKREAAAAKAEAANAIKAKAKKPADEDEEIKKAVAEAIKALTEERDSIRARHDAILLDHAFADPEVDRILKEGRYALPRSVVRQMFRDSLAVDEQGRVIPYKGTDKKEKMLSRTRHGEVATPAEAIGEWLATHPEKASFTLGNGASGGGAPGAATAAGNSNDTKRSPEARLAAAYAGKAAA